MADNSNNNVFAHFRGDRGRGDKKPRPWALKLTQDQFNCIIRGMEFYHRMMCGQLGELSQITPNRPSDDLLHSLKGELFPELDFNEDYGWEGNNNGDWFDKEIAQSYQIYREMRHQNVVNEGIENVYSSPTLSTKKADKLLITKKSL